MITWLTLLTALTAPAAPLPSATQQDTLPTLDQVIERHIEAIGGREAIVKLTTRVTHGREVTDLPTWSPPVHESAEFWIYAKTPGKYRFAQASDGETHREGYDGQVCWKWVDGELNLDAHCDRRFAWLIDPQNVLRIKEYFPDMQLIGSRTLGGRPVYRVDIDDDESHSLYFDAETGLLVRLGYNRELSDYREVDGVLVPFRYSISRKGGSSTYYFDEIEHNVTLEDTVFSPPHH